MIGQEPMFLKVGRVFINMAQISAIIEEDNGVLKVLMAGAIESGLNGTSEHTPLSFTFSGEHAELIKSRLSYYHIKARGE